MALRWSAVAIAVGVLGVVPARADVDMTGRWFVTGVLPTPGVVQFTQSGTTLTMDVPFFPNPGTIDPASGAFGFNEFSGGGCVFGLGAEAFPGGRYFAGKGVSLCLGSLSVGRLSGTRCSCFDGNTTAGDGCSPECQVEECFDCVGDPSVCTPTPDGGGCTDHRDCTAGETCSSGLCGGGAAVPACTDMTGLWKVARTVPGVFPDLSETRIYDVRQRDGILFLTSLDRLFEGSVDPGMGAFVTAHAISHPLCGADRMSGTVAGDGQTFAASGVLQVVDSFRPDVCGFPTAFYAGERTTCSDGALDPGEACDDGNRTAGDGCDGLCGVETCWSCTGSPSVCTPHAGGACDDGNACTGPDACTAAGSCLGAFLPDGTDCGDDPAQCASRACSSGVCTPSGPLACESCLSCQLGVGCVPRPQNCVLSTAPGKSQLQLVHGATPSEDKIAWRFKHGTDIPFGLLGDPPATTDWAMCLYDRSSTTPALLFRAVAAGGQTCGGKPCWRAVAGQGYRFSALPPASDGTRTLRLRAAIGKESQAAFVGQGASLSGRPAGFPTMPLPTSLTVQLQGKGATCMSMDVEAASVSKNDMSRFTAHGR